MTPKQLVDALAKIGTSQRAFAKFIDTDERQVRRWVAGDSRIPGSVAVLLKLILELQPHLGKLK